MIKSFIFFVIMLFLIFSVTTFPWKTCKTTIKNDQREIVLELCDYCFVPDARQSTKSKSLLTQIINSAILTPLNCFTCTSTYPEVISTRMYISEFLDKQKKAEESASKTNVTGVLAIISNKKLNSEDITDRIDDSDADIDSELLYWIFVNGGSSLFLQHQISDKILNITELKTSKPPTISSYIIDSRDGAPLWLELLGSLSVYSMTIVCFFATVLIRQLDKNHFVYSLELFMNCKRQREKLTLGIFIGRITIQGSIIGGLVIIVFELTFTMVPIPFQYILDVCFLLASSSCFMFLWARIVILIKRRKKHLTMRFQTLIVLPSILVGLLASVIIVLFKDETYLGAKSAMAFNKIGKFQHDFKNVYHYHIGLFTAKSNPFQNTHRSSKTE